MRLRVRIDLRSTPLLAGGRSRSRTGPGELINEGGDVMDTFVEEFILIIKILARSRMIVSPGCWARSGLKYFKRGDETAGDTHGGGHGYLFTHVFAQLTKSSKRVLGDEVHQPSKRGKRGFHSVDMSLKS